MQLLLFFSRPRAFFLWRSHGSKKQLFYIRPNTRTLFFFLQLAALLHGKLDYEYDILGGSGSSAIFSGSGGGGDQRSNSAPPTQKLDPHSNGSEQPIVGNELTGKYFEQTRTESRPAPPLYEHGQAWQLWKEGSGGNGNGASQLPVAILKNRATKIINILDLYSPSGSNNYFPGQPKRGTSRIVEGDDALTGPSSRRGRNLVDMIQEVRWKCKSSTYIWFFLTLALVRIFHAHLRRCLLCSSKLDKDTQDQPL